MRPMTSLINILRILGNLTKALQIIYFKTTKHLNSFVSHCSFVISSDIHRIPCSIGVLLVIVSRTVVHIRQVGLSCI